jgi:hypothetical protein
VQRRRAARGIEGPAQNLAVDRDDALRQCRKARHETLKTGAERLRIQQTKNPAERVMAGQTVFQRQKATQERLFVFGEFSHVHRRLAATQHRAQSNHQNLPEIMTSGIARPWIL